MYFRHSLRSAHGLWSPVGLAGRKDGNGAAALARCLLAASFLNSRPTSCSCLLNTSIADSTGSKLNSSLPRPIYSSFSIPCLTKEHHHSPKCAHQEFLILYLQMVSIYLLERLLSTPFFYVHSPLVLVLIISYLGLLSDCPVFCYCPLQLE